MAHKLFLEKIICLLGCKQITLHVQGIFAITQKRSLTNINFICYGIKILIFLAAEHHVLLLIVYCRVISCPIVNCGLLQGFALTSHLSDIERSEMRAYMAMIDNILVNAEVISN